jgi:hypothetical protein
MHIIKKITIMLKPVDTVGFVKINLIVNLVIHKPTCRKKMQIYQIYQPEVLLKTTILSPNLILKDFGFIKSIVRKVALFL